MSRGFSLLLTGTQAAERLGVSVQRVLHWAAQGRLPIAGQDEDGRALFREHVVETTGEDLVALVPLAERRSRKMRAT
jgi:predicted site-specific integrase-resolvase